MSYQRKVVEKPQTDHPLVTLFGHHKQFNSYTNDSGWILKELHELHNDGNFGLLQVKSVLESVREQNFSDYKPEIAKKKKQEPVKNARLALLTFLKKHIDKAKMDCIRVGNEILRVTEPIKPNDSTKAMLTELRNQEVRELIRSADPKDRTRMIRENLAYIQAVVESPDELISPEHLHEIRREYAFKQEPELRNYENDTIEIYQATRRRAGEINGTSVKMLLDEKLDDVITPEEHFAVFMPDTPMEQELANRRVHAFEQEQARMASEKLFDDLHPGVNLGTRRAAGFTEPKEKLPTLKRRV
ncbi:MAG: hypothetical protein C0399_05730 [Syntrophus sp. (in: bacteria)]|nr:hypothetical protein [Syntrophus sp. (in: bacteria)]